MTCYIEMARLWKQLLTPGFKCEHERLLRAPFIDDLTGSRLRRSSPSKRENFFGFSRARAAASPPKNSIAFQSVLVRYSLGMPETSLSGRNTRIARNVRRSISRCMPCENAVRILPQKHTHPATLYYLLLYYTNTYATLKYLYYVH